MYSNQETREVNNFENVASFLKKHMLFEYSNFYQNSQYYVQENFWEFTKKMHRSLNNVI